MTPMYVFPRCTGKIKISEKFIMACFTQQLAWGEYVIYKGGEKKIFRMHYLVFSLRPFIHRKEIPRVFYNQWPINWFSKMTNESLVCWAELIPTRSCWDNPTFSEFLRVTRRVSWLRFILIFYLFPENMADKKHKCSWYCVLSYRAAKDWNPKKQFSVEMKELGLLNPGGK